MDGRLTEGGGSGGVSRLAPSQRQGVMVRCSSVLLTSVRRDQSVTGAWVPVTVSSHTHTCTHKQWTVGIEKRCRICHGHSISVRSAVVWRYRDDIEREREKKREKEERERKRQSELGKRESI